MDEEEMLKRITRLLEQGGTMLATHHTCGAPEFRYRGQVVCPVCSFKEASTPDIASEEKEGPSDAVIRRGVQEEKKPTDDVSIKSAPSYKAMSYAGATSYEELCAEEADLRRVVLSKLKELTVGIEKEQDLDKLRKQFDCIEAALKVLRSMER